MHLALQFTEGSIKLGPYGGVDVKMVFLGKRRETGRKGSSTPSFVSANLKISGNRSYEEITTPQRPALNITEAVGGGWLRPNILNFKLIGFVHCFSLIYHFSIYLCRCFVLKYECSLQWMTDLWLFIVSLKWTNMWSRPYIHNVTCLSLFWRQKHPHCQEETTTQK